MLCDYVTVGDFDKVAAVGDKIEINRNTCHTGDADTGRICWCL